jgi:hypothetical protein
MALGDGIRRNIAHVEPTERTMLRDALIQLNNRFFPGSRTDPIPGGVSWWFKQDEIHQATHVHEGPEFLPWHREIVNRLEAMLRQINPQLSLHYWDWTQDPRAIPNANLGGGTTGVLNLFTTAFMGYGGSTSAPIGEPWLSAGYYVPGANPHRDGAGGNAADPPQTVTRFVSGSPASTSGDTAIVNAADYPAMRRLLESAHNAMHGFVNMGGQHVSFRDPFVFLLHSNVDRLFAMWQTDPAHPERIDPNTVYGSESNDPGLNSNIRPWSGVPPTVRPWAPPENEREAKNYKHPSVVTPPSYASIDQVPRLNFKPTLLNFGSVKVGETKTLRLTVQNLTGKSVTISLPAPPPGSPFQWAVFNGVLANRAETGFNVTFRLASNAIKRGSLTITSNAPGSPHVIGMVGKGPGGIPEPDPEPEPPRKLEFIPGLLNFGSVKKGDVRVLTLTIKNPTVTSVNISFPGSPAGSVFQWTAFSGVLGSGGQKTVNVTFKSTGAIQQATLVVTSNAPGSPHSIGLLGKGLGGF